jgi:hypothetical protein
MRTQPLRYLLAVAAGMAMVVAMASPALALPSATADAGVSMVNDRVDDIVIVGGNTWLGGKFSKVEDGNGNAVASASGITVLNSAGSLVGSLHSALPDLTGSGLDVYDLSLGPNGILYAAGKFGYSVGGKSYKNLIGIDTTTGKVAATFTAPSLKCVLATSSYVYAGGRKLQRYQLNGGKADGSWHSMVAYADPSLRSHTMQPTFREIDQADTDTLIVAGQFDWIDGQDAAHQKKVAVLVDIATGQPDLGSGSWSVDCTCASQAGAAFGLGVEVAGGIAYIAAGGNDWVGAFKISDGSRIWETDVNGSAQDLTVYDSSTVIVGGHWTMIEISGTGDQSASECPPRNASNPDPCWKQPRLAAISRSNGLADTSWAPNVCCMYRGVWATTVSGSTVHVGGEFTKLDNDSGPENYYGRFS